MNYYCNPININYRYQIPETQQSDGKRLCWREAADPSMIFYKGRYYIFASMTLGVWVSDDLAHWESHRLPDTLPLYDYAPDVRVMGDYVYYCASRALSSCDRYRTKDILNGPYEKLPGNFPFWDPNLFIDDDGRVYFYWGCSNIEPVYGTELNPETMLPVGQPVGLIKGQPETYGYERVGEDHSKVPGADNNRPFIEGAWMDKHEGRYYLQYAFAGTEYNIYGDGVYVGEHPLGPFRLQKNNPYSYYPGGFIPGAGHGSTMADRNGNFWHTSTMRISMNHIFERRVGLWPAGYDEDGELFCNQRFGDWPRLVPSTDENGRMDPWADPVWMLLSAGKKMTASSFAQGHPAANASVEDVQSWWKPATRSPEEWLQMDLGKLYTVFGIQVNFADDAPDLSGAFALADNASDISGAFAVGDAVNGRFIAQAACATRWKLYGSEDGIKWFVIADKSEVETDLCHDFIVCENGVTVRYLKLTQMSVPYGQVPCISGLRVFGIGDGNLPEKPKFKAVRVNDLDMWVEIIAESSDADGDGRALGYSIVWGHTPEKLYHSRTLFGTKVGIGALVLGEDYYVRVDAFNENGITEGNVQKLQDYR